MQKKVYSISKSLLREIQKSTLKESLHLTESTPEKINLCAQFKRYFEKYAVSDANHHLGIFILHYAISRLDCYENPFSDLKSATINNKMGSCHEIFDKVKLFMNEKTNLVQLHPILPEDLELDEDWGFYICEETSGPSQAPDIFSRVKHIRLPELEKPGPPEKPSIGFSVDCLLVLFKCFDKNYFSCLNFFRNKIEKFLKKSIFISDLKNRNLTFANIFFAPPDLKNFFDILEKMINQSSKKHSTDSSCAESTWNALNRNQFINELEANLTSFERQLEKMCFLPTKKTFSNLHEFLVVKINEIMR